MNDRPQDRLYALLPSVYRERDAAEGYPLRALLGSIQEQSELVREDIRQLWDDFFIETCRRWVIPYIGDLVGNDPIHDGERAGDAATAEHLFADLRGPDLLPPLGARLRADVAKTVYFRRRKGTPPMLEELARDVTGWPARAVESFRLLEWTQHLGHPRQDSLDCADLRYREPLDRLDGPFDAQSHTVDLRPTRQVEGRYNIPNIVFFLWRLRGYPLRRVRARKAREDWQYHFSPLGNPAPLFNAWRREGDDSALATELDLPGPIRPWAFHGNVGDYWGQAFSVSLSGDGDPIEQDKVICTDLRIWKRPAGDVVGVDVRLGRIAFGDGCYLGVDSVYVDYRCGFAADLGGGTYPRGKWLVRPSESQARLYVAEDGRGPARGLVFTSVRKALAALKKTSATEAVICILDSRSYGLPGSIELGEGRRLVIEAADGQRPLLQTPGTGLAVRTAPRKGARLAESELTLSGVVVEGHLEIAGDLGRLRLLHSTLVPGRRLRSDDGAPATRLPSLSVAGDLNGELINVQLRVEIAYSISGPLRIPGHAEGLWVLDSIVDGLGGPAIAGTTAGPQAGREPPPAPVATLERVTVFGASHFKQLASASTTIFTASVRTDRRQEGCVRFSYVPRGSETPRRYRCQPDLEIATAIALAKGTAPAPQAVLDPAALEAIAARVATRVTPCFTSSRYGDPGYAQLGLSCPEPVRAGAEDGAEMGAFNHLKQPQRETNLRIRLDEYLPFGLDAGIVYVT